MASIAAFVILTPLLVACDAGFIHHYVNTIVLRPNKSALAFSFSCASSNVLHHTILEIINSIIHCKAINSFPTTSGQGESLTLPCTLRAPIHHHHTPSQRNHSRCKLILLSIIEVKMLVLALFNEMCTITVGVPNLNSRNSLSITMPRPKCSVSHKKAKQLL